MMLMTMTLWGALLIAIIAMIRMAAMHRLSKKVLLILWALILVRLFVPFTIPTGWITVLPAKEMAPTPLTATFVDLLSSVQLPASGTTISNDGGESATAVSIANSASVIPFSSFKVIWLIGVFGLAVYFLWTHYHTIKQFRTSLPVADPFVKRWLAALPLRRTIQVRQSDRIISPLTYGIWRPIILLPKSMNVTDQDQLQYVLTHELVHIKRFDSLFKWLLVAALCLHWFNPFVWLMFLLANRDIELSCDEAVVWTLGQHQKSAYALTLIRLAESKSKLTALYSSFSKNSIEERIVAIMKIRKTNLFAIILVLVLAAGTTMTFAASTAENRSLGSFDGIPELDASKHARHVNIIEETEEKQSLSIHSTLFTDHRVYAVIHVNDEAVESFSAKGRIAYSDSGQTYYLLAGELKELAAEDGVRQFLYSATIAPDTTPANIDPQLALAAGNDHFLKRQSLWWDHEGKALELTVTADENELLLTAPVTNVYTDRIVVHPYANHYVGKDYYDTVVLTPYELLMKGTSTNTFEDLWFGPYVKITIVLADQTEINFSYDTRGLIYDEFYTTASSHGYNDINGKFYGFWNFRNWDVDLDEVTALLIDGVRYTVDKRK